MNKLVSILMPVFNAEQWLTEAIQSVFNQTYSNWELIIVDDGSTDKSIDLLRQFAQLDKRIKLFQQKNQGACAARNYAFEMSQGEYIQYLDADDILSDDKLFSQLNALYKSKEDKAISTCGWNKFKVKKGDIVNEKVLINRNYQEPVKWLVESWLFQEHSQTACWLVPRGLIQKAGPWNVKLSVNQDGEFFSRVILNASSIIFVEGVCVYYRMGNPESISQRKLSFKKAESLLNSFFLYEQHLTTKMQDLNIKKGLLVNYFFFLSQYDRFYPQLSPKVWKHIYKLGKSTFDEVSRQYGNFIIRKLGFKNYLRLARIKWLLIN